VAGVAAEDGKKIARIAESAKIAKIEKQNLYRGFARMNADKSETERSFVFSIRVNPR
jgi:hypothetical protein